MKKRSVGSGRYLWFLKIVFFGFKIIGLAPFTLETNVQKMCESSRSRTRNVVKFSFSKIGVFYNVMFSTLLLVITAFAFPFMLTTNYANKSSISQAEDVTQLFFCVFSTCIIMIFWALRQDNAASITKRLVNMDFLISGLEMKPRSDKNMSITFMIHIIVSACIWTSTLTSDVLAFGDVFAVFTFFEVPAFVIYWFMIQYYIVVNFVSTKLVTINKILSKFDKFSNHSYNYDVTTLNLSTNRELAALQILKTIRTTVSEVSHDISGFYSFPILACIAYSFIALVYNGYYLISSILVSSYDLSFWAIIHTVTQVMKSVYPLTLISFKITETENEAKLTGWIIHKLLASAMQHQDIKAELEQFSLQLLHENIRFTACGLFSLDCTLLHSILAATATYLVILIQFLQSTRT